jgi:RNA polymerase sigma factor (sigma-70 family)
VGGPGRAHTHAEAGLVRHAPALRAAARALCRNSAECEDLVQETFERALHHLAGGDQPVRHVRAWLVAIVRNAFIDRIRTDREMRKGVEQSPAPEQDQQPPWAEVTVADVRAACAQIGADLRAVFELHYLAGLRYREIAIRLSVPENTVAGRLFRARNALRNHLLASSSEVARGEGRVRTER